MNRVLIAAALVASLAACDVATAPGRVLSKTVETDNIILSYEWFHDANANYDARLGQLAELRKAYIEEPDPAEKARLRVDLSAVRQSCRELATKYNANSQKVNKSIFKSGNLPVTLNQQFCEE